MRAACRADGFDKVAGCSNHAHFAGGQAFGCVEPGLHPIPDGLTANTPFSALAFIQKMHAITDPNHRIAIPTLRNRALADVIQRCLDRNARTRITMQARCGIVHASDGTPQPGMHRAYAEVSHMS